MTKPVSARRGLLLAALVAFGACDEVRDGTPDDLGEPAYPVVRNGSDGAWTPETAWTFTQVWRQGGLNADESYVFSDDALALAAGEHGQLIVADKEGETVRVYDREGRFVRHLGGPGEGPGEWKEPLAVNTDLAGQVWMVSFASLRYNIYDTAGTYLRSLPRGVHGFPRLMRPGAFDTTGAFLDEIAIPGPLFRKSDFAVARVDTATGEILDTLLGLPIPRPRVEEIAPGIYPAADPNAPPNPARHFLAHLVVELTPTAAWIADSRTLRLVQLAYEGDTLLVAETIHRDHLVLTPDEERIIEDELRRRGHPPEGSPYPYGREIVQAIHALDEGYLLVLIEDEVGEPGHLLDVFDPDGQFLGTLEVGFAVDPSSTMSSRGDTLFLVGLDEWGSKSIARLVIGRP